MNRDFKFPQEQLELISEYVQKGITASKQSESQFYGEFRSQMSKVTTELKNVNEKLEKHDAYLKRTEPVIKAFEENKIFIAGAKKIGKNAVVLGGGLSVLSGAWYLIKHWLINLR